LADSFPGSPIRDLGNYWHGEEEISKLIGESFSENRVMGRINCASSLGKGGRRSLLIGRARAYLRDRGKKNHYLSSLCKEEGEGSALGEPYSRQVSERVNVGVNRGRHRTSKACRAKN